MTPPPLNQFPDIRDEESGSRKKLWHVGTLTYTTGGLCLLFFWLLWGDFAWAMKERSVNPVAQLLLKKLEASDTLMALLIGSFPSLVTMILGPIISYKSDRHRGRWGRRIPFLLIPTPIAALSMIGLALSPQLGAWLHEARGPGGLGLNASILLFFGLFWTSFEFSSVTANSVFGGLVNDVVPQAVIGRFYGMFRALSLIVAMMFNYWLLGKAENHYAAVFLSIGLLYGIGFTMMCLRVKEGTYAPPPPIEPGRSGATGAFAAVKDYFRECFGNSYFICFFIVMGLSHIAFAPINLFTLFYAKSLHMDINDFGASQALTYCISLALAYPLGALADRFHPLRVCLAAQALHIMSTLLGGLYIHNIPTFYVAMVSHGVLSGAWYTASASLGARLLPRARFAQIYAAAGIFTSLGTIIIGPGMGLFLDHAHHIYRYTYLVSCSLTTSAFLMGLVLHAKFMKLGGPRHYVAPE